MKKIILTMIIALILVGFVGAGILGFRNVNTDIDSVSKTKLAEYDITTPQTSEIVCDGETCEYKMFQILPDGSKYNLGTHKMPEKYCSETNTTINSEGDEDGRCLAWTDYTSGELETTQKDKIETWLENYAEVLTERENRVAIVKGTEGEIVLNNK